MNVLIACEESQRVCEAFRERGHNAYSCDVVKCSGGHPEWHIKDNALYVLGGGEARLEAGMWIDIPRWDLIIAHPPCTYLTLSAARYHSRKVTAENRIEGRTIERLHAIEFFMRCIQAPCERIAVENPIGIMSTVYRRPDQIIHPWMFADGVDDTENYQSKATCLWLKGLPELVGNDIEPPNNSTKYGVQPNGKSRSWASNLAPGKERSVTFPGIANAMAEQWGG